MCLYIHSIITYVPKHTKLFKTWNGSQQLYIWESINAYWRFICKVHIYDIYIYIYIYILFYFIYLFFCLFTLSHVDKYLKYLSLKFKP
jgi:hypothetical protein